MPHIAQPVSELYDIAVIGGGINGVGIAADAAGRGLSVFLCERDDLASHTSSASSKLIHGGLRYLEHYEFRLVREALAEREVLLAKAPHIVKPMRFVLPHRPHLRPAWMIRAGLFLYDHLGMRKKLPASQGCASAARARSSRPSPAVSSTPTAGSTTHAWWCSTPWRRGKKGAYPYPHAVPERQTCWRHLARRAAARGRQSLFLARQGTGECGRALGRAVQRLQRDRRTASA